MVIQELRWHKRHGIFLSWASLAVTTICLIALILVASGEIVSLRAVVTACTVAAAGVWTVGLARYRFVSYLNSRGIGLERVAIFGASQAGVELAHRTKDEGLKKGQVLVGIFDNRESRFDEDIEAFGIAGNWDNLADLAAEKHIDHVIICLPFVAQERLNDLMDRILGVSIRVTLVPDDGAVAGKFIELTNMPIRGWRRIAKGALDRIGGGIGLILISPFLLLIGILVKFDSPGPVLFYQDRTGFNDQIFHIVKFRTMYGPGEDGHNMKQAVAGDGRVTRIGRILRRFSIDELPQLINVVKGDMSLVGPRPHTPGDKAVGRFFHEVFHGYAGRHRVKPGITGWAQVHGFRGETDKEEKLISRVQADLYYINNWSLWLDFEILLRTIPAVLKG